MVSVRLLLVGPVGSENVIPFSSGIPTGDPTGLMWTTGRYISAALKGMVFQLFGL